MARASLPVELYGQNNGGDGRRYTCAATSTITKGDLLTFIDPRTASYAFLTGAIFAGIANMDKDGTEGSTSITAWTNGIFEMTASGAISVGQKVKVAAPGNYVMAATTTDTESSFATIVGVALEAASDTEVINVRVLI